MRQISKGLGIGDKLRDRLKRWMWVVLWMGVIFVFSAQPQPVLNWGQPAWVGKLAHLIEYLILGWLSQRALVDRRAWWRAWLIAVVYAVTDEIHQRSVPGRTSLATDVMVDALGAAVGVVLALWR